MQTHLWGPLLTIAKTLTGLVLGLLLMLNLNYMDGLFKAVAPLDYIRGRVSRETYISRYRPAYKLHVYAGRHLSEGSRILGQFLGNRRYYSQHDMVFADSLLKDLVTRYGSGQSVSETLNAMGITHIMIRQDLFEKWVAENFKPDEISVLKTFFSGYLTLLHGGSGYILYKLI